ncbi:cytochrome c oxidase subunit 3 [Agrobacterium tumefaciens]|uniref:cytochrome c oxidase subunit 3 n=1 Tax=Agrobacterium tumefaciens TaxID=358 RepID=UPI001576BE28|nr:cytochrome c oxidase subunit 3 [Agrobacterium tumefaciens]NTZ92544.1 cytochrome c oxidase subunit 3 family protein [Agrobacterium tumefaciens]
MAINTEEESGNLLLWILVWSELAAFGALTGAFIIAFALNPDAFAAARQHLQPQLAGLNTLILLASGWQAAVAASRHTALPGKRRALVLAGLLGFAFVGVKLHEYSTEIAFASDPAYGAFFELYFLLTGFHLLHVIFVAILLFIVACWPKNENITLVTTLWHVIDLVWIVIFPVVYLV